MSDLTTKAAEIRAGLAAELRAACVGHPNASIAWPHRVLHQAVDLIEQQAAELAGCEPYLKPGETPRQRMERYHAEVLGLMKLLVQDREKRTTAEAERDELLREKERMGAALGQIVVADTHLVWTGGAVPEPSHEESGACAEIARAALLQGGGPNG